ncbi:MAG: isoleucine--tRNA ligase [Deltaproteobacteria bacterium]|nr:isoleucine--tRNA ligase [Deltaproteobacteria bacterium]
MSDTKGYKKTIHLPRTDFPMKANLPRREPEIAARWEQEDVYAKLVARSSDLPVFAFHDGTPYANGRIHYGHVLNKVLKDIIVKHRSMAGYLCRYIPGWDCHGLPIELAAVKERGGEVGDPLEVRASCRAYAERFIGIQMEAMKRLGTFGAYDAPYKTIHPGYEAAVIRGIAAFARREAIYRGLKPVYWCASCHTALAEAEVEYRNHTSDSIYVRFPVQDAERGRILDACGVEDGGEGLSVLIWTTTPWTLPANLAIALRPDYTYSLLRPDGSDELLLIATDMHEDVCAGAGVAGSLAGRPVKGKLLEGILAHHPFIDRPSPLVLADYVTLEAGTGAVHTAPGHGSEDYGTGVKYGLDIYAPLDDGGHFTDDVEHWAGMSVFDANAPIVEHLHQAGFLLNRPGETLTHSYPHCWRCKQPVIFRATPQWFISMQAGGLRERALEEIDRVRWVPHWGRERIHGMIENRPDWCISRQRIWGVPLPFFYCKQCEEPLVDAGIIESVADLFEREGSDAWWTHEAGELVPEATRCTGCGASTFRKEKDIFDVWFESGMSWYAVCVPEQDQGFEDHDPLKGKVDLYLEGSDQHRGWFHTALLTGVGVRDQAPYETVLTHGFVVDDKGRAFSKSEIEKRRAAGEKVSYVPPEKTIERYGADILRLWVAYEDFRNDIAYSEEILKRLSEAYRKFRNTFRFLLGNLGDFDPERDGVPRGDMLVLDRWAMARLDAYVRRMRQAYDDYRFHRVYHETVDLVTVDLSAFYLDVLKDRLYCEERTGLPRRSAQTVLLRAVRDLSRLLAPVLSFTSEEVWQSIPRAGSDHSSVFFAGLPEVPEPSGDDLALLEEFETLREARSAVTRKIEIERSEGRIGKSLEAAIRITAGPGHAVLSRHAGLLADLFIVSEVDLREGGEGFAVEVGRSDGTRCERCWKYCQDVGTDGDHPTLCARCASVVKQDEAG